MAAIVPEEQAGSSLGTSAEVRAEARLPAPNLASSARSEEGLPQPHSSRETADDSYLGYT